MKLCSGDIGFSARLCYDLVNEGAAEPGALPRARPARTAADFQARRAMTLSPGRRETPGRAQGPVFCHTINGSGLAVGRALVALLETYQNDDGSLTRTPSVSSARTWAASRRLNHQ